jgi:hypothetical protein
VSSDRIAPTAAQALLACLLLLLAPGVSAGQATETGVRGQVVDGAGEPVSGVLITAIGEDTPPRTAVTGAQGRFRIAMLAPGSYRLRAEALGYRTAAQAVEVVAGEEAQVAFTLERAAVAIEGVVVEGRRTLARERRRFEEEAGVTARVIGGDELRALPGLAEADVLRAIEALPGVITTSDFSAAFHVRGGSADQNLVLLDGFPIFNPFHLGGVFSVFNADAVGRAELFAGGFGAEYGGRVSSVLSVESVQPPASGVQADVGVSLLASRATVRAGLGDVPALGISDLSGYLALRRSYLDTVLRPVIDFPYHLGDLQFGASFTPPGGGRLSLVGYAGEDVLDLTDLDGGGDAAAILRIGWDWGNRMLGATWEREIGEWDLAARLGRTTFATSLGFADFDDIRFASEIGQTTGRLDLVRERGGVELGLGASAGRLDYRNLLEGGGTVFDESDDDGWETGAYAQLRWRPGDRWIVEGGGRLDRWDGRGATHTVAGPRFAVKRFLGAERASAVKLAAGRYGQFLHSLRDEDLPFGIDTWVGAGEHVPPIVSDQVQVGWERFWGTAWQVAADVYLRRFDGVTAFNIADDPNDPADDLLVGSGDARGVDLLVRRGEGRLTGWLALSLLRATRTFEDPTAAGWHSEAPPITYPPLFDRRVSVDLVASWLLPADVDLGFRWTFGSGLPYTRPVAQVAAFGPDFFDGRYRRRLQPLGEEGAGERLVVLGERNAARYPPYHRLDASVRRDFERRWGTVTPYLQVLNVYDRRNVLFYFYNYDRSPPTRSGISMFPFLPTLGVDVSW